MAGGTGDKKGISKIIRFRNRQRKCCDLSRCSGPFNYFVSCCNTVFKDRKPCSYANSYYPFHLIKSLDQIACVFLNTQGRYVPSSLKKRQKKSFFCYGRYVLPLTDNPLF